MCTQILEVQTKLETKRKDIEKLQEKERAVELQFRTTIGDNKFADYLTKVFRKRIKRTKKKATEGEGRCPLCFKVSQSASQSISQSVN